MRQAVTLDELKGMVGQTVGTSDWILVDQERIDRFADVTGDHQFIHVNPELARQTPFGTTIAHGFLTLSLMSLMGYQAMPVVEGVKMGVNYGLNRVRFLAPVKSGKRIRGHFRLADVAERAGGAVQTTYEVTVEIEDEEKPALHAEWLTVVYL
ncbi:MAG: MaoC family dehydratase [Thermaurantiacus tibetensis]|uniref:MaoC family dehydratase n=1 Tax=Thermaurantiacus tibetensis TaxID=2759035 RepID=UPI00188E5799|nr:MaoC family dehydratase [Thermaurantiacus tibetensis]